MAQYKANDTRNIVLASHAGAGKTSLIEAMLYDAGVLSRLGEVDAGTSFCDYTPEEMKRKITISSKFAHADWKERRINIIDTPGYAEFVGEARTSLRVADGAILLIDGVSGIEVGLEKSWEYCDEYGLPRIMFINKLDKEGSDFLRIYKALHERWPNVLLLQVAMGKEGSFHGLVDLLTMKAMNYSSGKAEEGDIPADVADTAKEYREKILEAAAETDDRLLEKYLGDGEISPEEVASALRSAVLEGKLVPVLCGTATKNMGADLLLDCIADFMPSPLERGKLTGKDPAADEEEKKEWSLQEQGPFCAYVYKTVSEPHVGALTLFRIYSGSLNSGSDVYNVSRGKMDRVGQLLRLQGKEREEVSEAIAGDIVAVAKLKETSTGDTFCDKSDPIVLNRLEFPPSVISVAVKPSTKKDQEKMATYLGRLVQEDPTLNIHMDHEFSQTVLSGMGELHLEVAIERLRERYGVQVTVEKTRVAYRETIRKTAEAEGKYKKQTGGRGQFGIVQLRVEPFPDGEFEFANKIRGGAVPSKYIPAVEKGVRGAMKQGYAANISELTIDLSQL